MYLWRSPQVLKIFTKSTNRSNSPIQYFNNKSNTYQPIKFAQITSNGLPFFIQTQGGKQSRTLLCVALMFFIHTSTVLNFGVRFFATQSSKQRVSTPLDTSTITDPKEQLVAEYGKRFNDLFKRRQWSEIGEAYEELKLKNLVPDRDMYLTVMKAYQRMKKPEKIIKVFHDMNQNRVKLGRGAFNSLISAYAKDGDSIEVMKWVNRMQQYGYKPDQYTYSSMVEVNARCGDFPAAWKALEDMQERLLEPLPGTYLTMLHFFKRREATKEVAKVVEIMKSKGMSVPPEYTAALVDPLMPTALPK